MLLSRNGFVAPLGWYPSGDLGLFTYYCSRKRKVVAYLRTKQVQETSPAQARQRRAWTTIALEWKSIPATSRAAWRAAAAGARIRITAYNLYIFYRTTKDLPCLQTICNQARIPLASLL
jgi:hypothetical protein